VIPEALSGERGRIGEMGRGHFFIYIIQPHFAASFPISPDHLLSIYE
jgi:hypothetical protein